MRLESRAQCILVSQILLSITPLLQGPLIIQSALEMDIPLHKSIMALAYGDQITNMMQPFWALPLLGITGLKAKDILPYTFLLMLVGIGVFIFGFLFL